MFDLAYTLDLPLVPPAPGAANTLLFNGARRVRVLCTQSLGTGAFTSTSLYTVTSLDGLGASPSVNAVFAIAGSPQAVELAVSADLAPGGLYRVAFAAMPFSNGTTFTGSLDGRLPLPSNTPNPQAEPSTGDFDLLFYGRDLLLGDSGDFALDATGDLATIAGQPNWQQAITRRVMSDGIPWDGSYGAKPKDYVNAPTQYQLPLSARIVQQARADDRTLSAQVQLVPNPAGLKGAYAFQLAAQGRDGLSPITVTTPLPTKSS